MIKKEKPIVSAASNLITSFVTIGIGIITGIIVTRSLGPELKGQYGNLRLITSLYASFLIFGYHGGVLYYGIRKELDLERFFWTGWLVISGMAIAIVLTLFPIAQLGYLGTIASQASDYHILLALFSTPFILLNAYSERVIRSYHLFRASNLRILAGAGITLIYYLLLVFFYHVDLEQALWGIIVGQAVQLMMNIFFVLKYIRVSWSVDFRKIFKPFKYGIQNWVNQILNTSNDKLDQIILTFLLSAASFGIYTVAVGLSNLLTTLPTSYVNVFYNQIVGRDSKDALLLYAKAQRITFLITISSAFALAILAYPLIYFMYGKAFISAAFVVVLYTPGVVFQVASRLTIRFYAGRGKPLKNSLIYIAGIVVSLPFYFLLIPDYGIYGAAVASSIAYFSAFSFSFFQIHRQYGLALREIIVLKKDDVRFIKQQLVKLPVIGKIFSNERN